MKDPFRPLDPRCTCATVGDALTAAFANQELLPCGLHATDEVAELKRKADVANAEAERDRLSEVLEELLEESMPPDELQAKREAKALAALDPLERSLHLKTKRSHLPLNHPSITDLPAGPPDAA